MQSMNKNEYDCAIVLLGKISDYKEEKGSQELLNESHDK